MKTNQTTLFYVRLLAVGMLLLVSIPNRTCAAQDESSQQVAKPNKANHKEQQDASDVYTSVRELPGVTIYGTPGVDEGYLEIAAEVYRHMTSRREPYDIPALHKKSNFKILLISEQERFSELPEYKGQGRMIDRAGGLGGQIGEFFIGVRVGDPHVLVHELGHGIYHSAIQYHETGGETDEEKWYSDRVKAVHGMEFDDAVDKFGEDVIHEVLLAPEGTFSARLADAWKNAQVKKFWKGTYAGSEPNEYWAEGVTMWFRAYSEVEGDSRDYLKEKDPGLYDLCASIFPSDDWKPRDAAKAAGVKLEFSNDREEEADERDTEEQDEDVESLDELFNELDRNKDGKIQRSEVPEEDREGFDDADQDSDGVLTRAELQEAIDDEQEEGGNEDDDDDRDESEGATDLTAQATPTKTAALLKQLDSADAIKANTEWNIAEMRKRCEFVSKNEQGYYEAKLADGHVLILVPQGSFQMGTDHLNRLDKPVHEVGLKGYWIAKYLVTNKQFGKFVEETGFKTDAEKDGAEGTFVYDFKRKHFRPTRGRNWRNAFEHCNDNHPVVGPSWFDSMEYCKWLGGKLRLKTMSLPTEAQWEKAARGTDGRRYPWGNDAPDGTRANYCDAQFAKKYPGAGQGNPDLKVDDGFANTSPVDAFPKGASPYGVFDMGGNVSNWIFDFVDRYPNRALINPAGPSRGDSRGMRGGFWVGDAGLTKASIREQHNLRSECRSADDPYSSDDHLGFRFAVQLDGPDLQSLATGAVRGESSMRAVVKRLFGLVFVSRRKTAAHRKYRWPVTRRPVVRRNFASRSLVHWSLA